MTPEAWNEGWGKLGVYFHAPRGSNEDERKTRARLYHEQLEPLTDRQFREAVKECIDTLPANLFPSIAQLRECAGLAPENVRRNRLDDLRRASPEFRAEYQAKYGPIVSIDEQDLCRSVAAEDLWCGGVAADQLAHVEAVARDYPRVEDMQTIDHIERLAVLSGLMQPIRLAGWTIAEIKVGRRDALLVAPVQHQPITINLPQHAPETFMETAAAERLERRIREQDAKQASVAAAPQLERAIESCRAPDVQQLKPAPPAMTPEPEEEFF